MKIPLLVGITVAGLALTLAVPRFGGACDRRSGSATGSPGTPVACDTVSGHPCTLVVKPGPATVVDRGHLVALRAPQEIHGTYRYQQELEHRVLYVYDEVQNLVDPEAVMLREPLQ